MPAKRRNFPSETKADTRPMKADTRPMGMTKADMLGDLTPAMQPSELTELERLVEIASPEVFQQELSKVLRKMMVRGLREIPAPRSIKELQAMYDMFRKAEGIERADKHGGAVVGGFLPRVVGRRSLGVKESTESTVIEYPKEVVETVTAEEVVPSGEEEFEV